MNVLMWQLFKQLKVRLYYNRSLFILGSLENKAVTLPQLISGIAASLAIICVQYQKLRIQVHVGINSN